MVKIGERAGRNTVLAAAVMVAASSLGCATLRAGMARQKYIHEQTQAHVYQMPIADVWPNVRKLLFERGYQVKGSDTGNAFSVETESKPGDAGSAVRYLVQGTKLDERSCRVEFTKMTSTPNGSKSDRDLDLEWQLLKRVDPAGAQQIETAAQAEGDKARSQS